MIKNEDLVYIKPNLVIEPLVNSWYAWSHLISPATAALNIKERHLKIMDSYIRNPQVHAAAVKNPKMLGGPFIDYAGKRVKEITQLRDDSVEQCQDLFTLCDAIRALENLLLTEANGYSLSHLYEKIPQELRGLVELFYDIHNRPSFRFFEPLLYHSPFYKESLQSFNLFLIDNDEARSFVLSTPKLADVQTLNVKLPFKSEEIDTFFSLSTNAKTYGTAKELFGITEKDEALFQTFFTREAPLPYQTYQGSGVLTRYFGHACILVETKSTSILVDPVVSYGYDSDISRFTYADLPDTIDYVLFTHNHQDHILFETLLRIRHKIKNIVVPRNGGSLQDPSLKLMFEKIGFKNIIELDEFETLRFSDCSITGLPFMGEHADLDIRSKICYLVNSHENNYRMIFAADSCNVEPRLYEKVKALYGGVDIIFLGMECDGAPLSWLYGPLLPEPLERDKDQTRRLAGCNFTQTRSFVDIFQPNHVFIYAMGMEPWLKYISSIQYTEESMPIIESDKVLTYCEEKGIISERLFGEKIIEYNPM